MRLFELAQFQFLTENKKVEYINKNMGPKLLQAAKQDKFYKDYETSEDVINKLLTLDPTPNKIALQWLANQYTKGNFRMEDAKRVSRAIEQFDRRKASLEANKRDLMKYQTLADLEDAVSPNDQPEVDQSSNKQLAKEAKANSKRIVDTPTFKIIQPTSETAACYYGAKTKWCTAAREDNQFDTYNNDGPLYIIIAGSSQAQRKFQMHVETESFMDERDEPVKKADIEMLSEIPEYEKFLAKIIDVKAVKHADEKQAEYDAEYEQERDNAYNDYPPRSRYRRYDGEYDDDHDGPKQYDAEDDDDFPTWLYSWTAHPEDMPGFKSYIVGSPALLVKAGIHSKKGLKGHLNTVLRSKDANVLAKYAAHTGERLPARQEELIARNAGAAAEYAVGALKARWPAMEDKILVSYNAEDYIKAFFTHRDAALEKKLLDPELALPNRDLLAYCEAIGQRWPAGEKQLLSDVDYLCWQYAVRVIKGRWPELEQALIKGEPSKEGNTRLAQVAVNYCKNVIKGRMQALEPVIFRDSYSSIAYAVYVAKQRIPEIEPMIAKEPDRVKEPYEKKFKIKL
jgi:hypothetical protein